MLIRKLPSIKKNIEAFLTSEEGKISKKSALELGMGVAMLGTMLTQTASAVHKSFSQAGSPSSHASYLSKGSGDMAAVHTSGGHTSHISHSSHSSHSSHTSHSSHASHSSHGSHGSHGSHSSHSSHGSHGSHVSHSSCGTCSCPFVSVWNGRRFVIDNNILPESENILRKETIIEELYKLEVIPKIKNKKYLLRVMEFEREHSYFHNFEFIKIIHPKESNIGIINNKIVAFKNLVLPSSIKDKKGKDWTKKLSALNDKAFFKGEKGEILNIRFDNIKDLRNCHLIFRASLRGDYPRIKEVEQKLERIVSGNRLIDSLKKIGVASIAVANIVKEAKDAKGALAKLIPSIHLSVIYADKNKEKPVEIVHPREKLSLGLVDISQYVKKSQKSLFLRAKWTRPHNVSFVGLTDTEGLSEVSNISQESIKLSCLKHSENKNIDKTYLKKGKVELIPGQYIKLEFPAKKEKAESNQRTSFVLKSKGYYTPF